MPEQLQQPDLSETILTSEPVEVPNMMAWRWRVEHTMREARIARYPSRGYYSLAESHAYFFEYWGSTEARGRDITFYPTDEASTDFPIKLSEDESDKLEQITLPLLSDLLGSNYPVFSFEPSDRYASGKKLKGFSIHDPKTFVDTLAEKTRSIHMGNRGVEHFNNLRYGLTIALAKTQDGSIFDVVNPLNNRSTPQDGTASFRMPGFNSILEEVATYKDDTERRQVIAKYLQRLRKAPIPAIGERALLHLKYSEAFEAIGNGFKALAEE